MPLEIERKFLLRDDGWRGDWTREHLRQGYLSGADGTTVRIRHAGTHAFLTIKAAVERDDARDDPAGAVRREYEYEIPFEHAKEMLTDLCRAPPIEKTRHRVEHAGRLWQIDEFFGNNHGLVLAEIELADPTEPLDRPSWLGAEVTGDPRYRNSFLARHPFRTWGDAERHAA